MQFLYNNANICRALPNLVITDDFSIYTIFDLLDQNLYSLYTYVLYSRFLHCELAHLRMFD